MKKPDMKFGLELEMSSKYKSVVNTIGAIIYDVYGKGLFYDNCSDYKSEGRLSKKWTLKIDASTEIELCSPISTVSDIRKICSVFRRMSKCKEIYTTKRDSIHLHIDTGNINKNKILINWLKNEHIIKNMFKKYRHKNGYSDIFINSRSEKENVAKFFIEAKAMSCKDYRNNAIYFIKGKKNDRVEIRISEAIICEKYIKGLINFFLNFVKESDNIDELSSLCLPIKSRNLNDFYNKFISGKHAYDWFESRIRENCTDPILERRVLSGQRKKFH